jgi:hypothetical protein
MFNFILMFDVELSKGGLDAPFHEDEHLMRLVARHT